MFITFSPLPPGAGRDEPMEGGAHEEGDLCRGAQRELRQDIQACRLPYVWVLIKEYK